MCLETRDPVVLGEAGSRVFGVFHCPLVDHPVPAVLVCHGFGGTKVGRYRMYVRLAEALVREGIATLRMDFRGCGDSEGSFLDTTLHGQVEDALAGLGFLRSHQFVDSSRIGLLGRSLGGPVAVLTARADANIQSLALWSAVFHGDPWVQQWQEVLRFMEAQGKSPKALPFAGDLANRELIEQFFAVNMDAELAKLQHLPLFCVHSQVDEVVDAEHCRHFQRCREKTAALTQFVHLETSNHDFSDPKERDKTIQETAAWYRKTLL